MIDVHTHIGQLSRGRPGLTAKQLLKRMDECGIEKAVVLSVENPEEVDFYVLTKHVLRACKPHLDRLIPFCNVDPRRRYPGHFDPYPIIEAYAEQGCKGFGENLAGIPVDDPMNQAIYEACGRLGLPIMMHFDYWINRDQPGLPAFEKMLATYKDTVFMAHGPNWWREISAREKSKDSYPKGKVIPGGRCEVLLKKYPNLYGDLSAGSGYNAITRDPDFGPKFLKRCKRKLLFGTDLLTPKQNLPIVDYFRDPPITKDACERITRKNAEKVLKRR